METKVYLLAAMIFCSIFSIGQNTDPIPGSTIRPDSLNIFDDSNAPEWGNTSFYNYNGVLLMFSSSRFDGSHSSKCYHNTRIYVYRQVYNNEGGYNFKLIQFGNNEYVEVDNNENKTPVPFEFKDHLWLSISRYLVKLPQDFLENVVTDDLEYFDKNTLVLNDDFIYSIIPQGDTLLNLFTIHEFPDASNTLRHKQAYINDNGDFIVDPVSIIKLHDYSSSGGELQDIIQYKDGYIINTLFSSGAHVFSSVVSYYNSKTKKVKQITSIDDCFESTFIKGSIYGQRETVFGDSADSERFTLFTISKIKNNGIYPINYYEYCLQGDDLVEVVRGVLHLPLADAPCKIYYGNGIEKSFFLNSVYNYMPKIYKAKNNNGDTIHVDTLTGLLQQVCLFYPVSKKSFVEYVLNSDVWRPNTNVLRENNLHNTTKYGNNIKDMWTLVGILDGPPPCSIDWETWENNGIESATELKFTTEEKTNTSLSISHKDEFTTGLGISFGDEEKGMHAKLTAKYTHIYENLYEVENETEVEITEYFSLVKENQNFAYYIWSIPASIMRAEYQIYPYWGAYSLKYPIDSTRHFMFRVVGQSIVQEGVDINDYPFLIDHPNDSSLNDWKFNNRPGIKDYPNAIIGSINIPEHGNPGSIFSFYKVQTQTRKISVSDEVEIEVEAGYQIPEIFSVDVSVGNSYEWAKEYTMTTSFGTGLEASLYNLNSNLDGLNSAELWLNIYYFEPMDKDNGWWFYDSLATFQHPWYFAYAVPSSNARINLIAPIDNNQLKSSDLLFVWEPEEEVLNNYSFYISSSPYFGQNNVIYEKKLGNETSLNLSDVELETEKTFYWRVSGMTEKGETVFSQTKSFITRSLELFSNNNGSIKATIFPNPISENSLNIVFSSSEEGECSVKIINMNGKLMYNNEVLNKSKVVSNLNVDISGFQSGIYIAVIQSGSSVYYDKIIVCH